MNDQYKSDANNQQNSANKYKQHLLIKATMLSFCTDGSEVVVTEDLWFIKANSSMYT